MKQQEENISKTKQQKSKPQMEIVIEQHDLN